MDFITGLLNEIKQHDAIMVIVDKLSKETHFIPIKSTYKPIYIANVFMKEIFILHGFLKPSSRSKMPSSPRISGESCFLV
jgi:hypothetical protein